MVSLAPVWQETRGRSNRPRQAKPQEPKLNEFVLGCTKPAGFRTPERETRRESWRQDAGGRAGVDSDSCNVVSRHAGPDDSCIRGSRGARIQREAGVALAGAAPEVLQTASFCEALSNAKASAAACVAELAIPLLKPPEQWSVRLRWRPSRMAVALDVPEQEES